MAEISIPIGTYKAIYIGDYDSSDALTQITEIDYDDQNFTDQTPMQYFPGLNLELQTGPRRVEIPLSFYSDDILLWNINRGVSIDNTNRDLAPGNNFYCLLLVLDEDDDSDKNIYIPKCRTERNLVVPRSKSKPTTITASFSHVEPNRFKDIVYYDTYAALDALLAGRSPL